MWDKPNCPSASESALPTRERFGAVERGSPIANPRAGNDVPQKLCGIGVRVCATSVAEKLFLRGLLAAGSPRRGLQPVRVMYHADWPHRTHFPPSLAAAPSVICPCSWCCSPAVGAPP